MAVRRWVCLVLVAGCAMGGPALGAARPEESGAPGLGAAARVRYVTEYPACGGLRREGQGPLPVGLRGLDRGAIARTLAPADVEVTTDLLTVVRRLPGCPEDTVTLVAQDGVVVVLAGPPGDNPGVLRRTSIPVRGLAPDDAARIEVGWGVRASTLADVLGRLAAATAAEAGTP